MRESESKSAATPFEGAEAARRWAQPLVETLADGLVALYLYGSANSPDFNPVHSDINLLLIARALPASGARALAAAWPGPVIGKNPVNLVILTRSQIERSLDTFAVELAEVKGRGRLLAGHDVLAAMTIPRESLRSQLERELLLVSVRLRRTFLNASQDSRARSAEVHAAIGTLVGCARGLSALGLVGPSGTADAALTQMAEVAGVDARPFHEAWRLRHDRAAASETLYLDLLDAVDAVQHRVDRHETGPR